MQRAAGGFDYRLRLVVPDLQPIDELEPASCTRKCLAAETLRGHSAECGGVARPLQNGRRRVLTLSAGWVESSGCIGEKAANGL